MAGLKSYSNIEDILANKGRNRGLRWKSDILPFLNLNQIPVTPNIRPSLELHVYDPDGETLLSSLVATNFLVENDEIFIDYAAELAKINIQRGIFKIVANVHHTLIGNSAIPMLTIKEISPDRRELQVVVRPDIDGITAGQRSSIINLYLEGFASAYDADLALNFGNNKLYKILAHKEWVNNDDIVIRLYEPLQENIQLNDTCWIIEELSDPIVDDINLNLEVPEPQPNVLRGPNFEVESNYNLITETDFETWNTLLDANLGTSQRIIDSYFSGSLSGINLGIDYTAFENFVNYSSARERIDNFIYKLQLVEYYDKQIGTLNVASGSNAGSFQNNINKYTRRKDKIIGEFDSFEKWLYNEPTASLTTHGMSGSLLAAERYSLTPYPKYLSAGKYVVHHTTSSLAQTWHTGFAASASLYDHLNDNSLIKTIPEHIRIDNNNSSYELFVNMIGQHFDILWTYIDNLTKLYKLEEQPKLSIDKTVLPDIAKSLGWELANGKQATQLWQYRLGTDSVGAFAQTGSIFSESDQEITHEVWRRIVNNLPYLLKTKGTARSIKALMNIYGIPQTLLSIREYGGPKVEEDVPALIEDRYSYAINFNSGSVIRYSSNHVSSSIGNWGLEKGVIPPISREFRFRPYTSSNMMVYTQGDSTQVPSSIIAIEHTGSYSGSAQYGRLVLSLGKAVSNTVPMTASTDWVPIFNGQYWNVRYYYTTTGDHYNSGSNTDTTYHLQVQNASDFIFGDVNFSSSLSITPTFGNHYEAWSEPGTDTTANIVYIGGTTASSDTHNVQTYIDNFLGSTPESFTGSMQEYREWLEEVDKARFDRHTLNPTSYVSSLSPTSSYDTLIRHYTFGSDTIGIDLSTNGTIISSSHPNQKIKDFVNNTDVNNTNATAIGFYTPTLSSRGNFLSVEETYYVEGVSSGMNSAKSQKIRFDDNRLINNLSPTSTSEVSKYDFASLDTNKLGLFYSFADQVNKDIFNQIGDIALDDYIGDPEDEFKNDYPLLKQFSENYWKKFTNTSDINSYIRVFSQYDFALFHQIKQLLPERVDEVAGLLVEPHALERNKQVLAKRPSVSNPQYQATLYYSPTSSAVYETEYLANIDKVVTTSAEFLPEYASVITVGKTGSLTLQDDLVIDVYRKSSIFKEVVYHYKGGNKGSLIQKNQEHAISESIGMYYSKSIKDADYMDDVLVKDDAIKYKGTQLVGSGINVATTIAALNNKPVVEVYETNPNKIIYTKQPAQIEKTSNLNPGNIIIK